MILAFFLEEPSAEEMLRGILPRLITSTDIVYKFVVFEGKSDLEKRLASKLKGWLHPDTKFIIMRDQDSENCKEVKARLRQICNSSGKPGALIRIACHELESFYLGDLTAVENGLGIKGISPRQRSAKFRDPDALSNPVEELVKITNKKYQKIAGSRNIAPHLDFDVNKSKSFNMLVDGIRKVTTC